MHILDDGKPPKARLLAPRMLDDMNYVKHRYVNNKRRLNLKKVFKDELYDFSTDDDNCLILLPFWKFQHFLGKQVHGRWRVIILARGTGVTIGQLIRNNMVVGTRGWFLKFFLIISDLWCHEEWHLYRTGSRPHCTLMFHLSKNIYLSAELVSLVFTM